MQHFQIFLRKKISPSHRLTHGQYVLVPELHPRVQCPDTSQGRSETTQVIGARTPSQAPDIDSVSPGCHPEPGQEHSGFTLLTPGSGQTIWFIRRKLFWFVATPTAPPKETASSSIQPVGTLPKAPRLCKPGPQDQDFHEAPVGDRGA